MVERWGRGGWQEVRWGDERERQVAKKNRRCYRNGGVREVRLQERRQEGKKKVNEWVRERETVWNLLAKKPITTQTKQTNTNSIVCTALWNNMPTSVLCISEQSVAEASLNHSTGMVTEQCRSYVSQWRERSLLIKSLARCWKRVVWAKEKMLQYSCIRDRAGKLLGWGRKEGWRKYAGGKTNCKSGL